MHKLLLALMVLLLLVSAACAGSSPQSAPTTLAHNHSHAGGHSHASGQTHASSTREATEPYPSVSLRIVDDPAGGWLINSVPTNFRLAPERVSTSHVEGEGHMHLYIDGVKITRLYSEWHQMPPLAAGSHVIRVELSANDHATLTRDGVAIDASINLDVSPEQATLSTATASS